MIEKMHGISFRKILVPICISLNVNSSHSLLPRYLDILELYKTERCQ